MTAELWWILGLCAVVPFAAWLGRVTAPEAKWVEKTVYRDRAMKPDSRVEAWFRGSSAAKDRWSIKSCTPAELLDYEECWRKAGDAAVAAWDADAKAQPGEHKCPPMPRFPTACAHCGSPIEPLKEGT